MVYLHHAETRIGILLLCFFDLSSIFNTRALSSTSASPVLTNQPKFLILFNGVLGQRQVARKHHIHQAMTNSCYKGVFCAVPQRIIMQMLLIMVLDVVHEASYNRCGFDQFEVFNRHLDSINRELNQKSIVPQT